MSDKKRYKCVNCGEPAAALFKTYGPSVLKLTKCEKCNGMVDKYIEYDPVIILIDLVLMSKEAQRHVIYNSHFKSFWKLFIILIILETYSTWRTDSLFNVAVKSLCDSQFLDGPFYLGVPVGANFLKVLRSNCEEWVPEARGHDGTLFIWEKDFYIQSLSTFVGITVFIVSSHWLLSTPKHKVAGGHALRAAVVYGGGAALHAPALVWPATPHPLLLLPYSAATLHSVLAVLYERSRTMTCSVLVLSCVTKYLTTFYATPTIRELLS